jgi:hypothetical protein
MKTKTKRKKKSSFRPSTHSSFKQKRPRRQSSLITSLLNLGSLPAISSIKTVTPPRNPPTVASEPAPVEPEPVPVAEAQKTLTDEPVLAAPQAAGEETEVETALESAQEPSVEGKRKRRGRVEWDLSEKEQVAIATVDERLRDPMAPFLQLVTKAQHCLDPQRRRNLATMKLATDIAVLFVERWEAFRSGQGHQGQGRTPQAAVAVPKPVDPNEFLASLPTSKVMLEACRRLIDLGPALGEGLQALTALSGRVPMRTSAVTKHPPDIDGSTETNSIHKIRIAVVGLKSNQQQEVEERTRTRPVELRFIDSSSAKTSYPSSAEWALISRFCDHRWYEQARHLFAPGRVLFSDGGVTDIIRKVYDIASRQPAAVA